MSSRFHKMLSRAVNAYSEDCRAADDVDHADRRVARRVDDNADSTWDDRERFVYDGEDLTVVYDETGTPALEGRYLHGPGIDAVLAYWQPGQKIRWTFTDRLGNVRDVVEINGAVVAVVEHQNYSSFGGITSDTNPSYEFRFGYTGRLWDADIGLQFNRARWYDPALGKWLSEDPLGFAAGDANLSRYVGNDPVNFTDPSGLEKNSSPAIGKLPGSDDSTTEESTQEFQDPPPSPGAYQTSGQQWIERVVNDWIENDFIPWFQNDVLDDIFGSGDSNRKRANAGPSSGPSPGGVVGQRGPAGVGAGANLGDDKLPGSGGGTTIDVSNSPQVGAALQLYADSSSLAVWQVSAGAPDAEAEAIYEFMRHKVQGIPHPIQVRLGTYPNYETVTLSDPQQIVWFQERQAHQQAQLVQQQREAQIPNLRAMSPAEAGRAQRIDRLRDLAADNNAPPGSRMFAQQQLMRESGNYWGATYLGQAMFFDMMAGFAGIPGTSLTNGPLVWNIKTFNPYVAANYGTSGYNAHHMTEVLGSWSRANGYVPGTGAYNAKNRPANPIAGLQRIGSALKTDPSHAFPDYVDNFVGYAQTFRIPTKGPGGVVAREADLYQLEGSLRSKSGVFEWIVDQGQVTHRRFIPGGTITGSPNQVPGGR